MGALLGIVSLGVVGLLGVLFYAATREAEAGPPPGDEEILEEVIDATLESGHVYWAALTEWRRVYDRYPNEWPADTDIRLAWTIENRGNVGAYFQVYMFDPGEWLYLEPGDERTVFESFHTPAVPVIPGYQYYLINILGRRISGERVGAVWTSREIEVTYI